MQLGAFSVSLAVKDIETSLEFYQKLGFKVVGGQISQNWLILRNQSTTIGLFRGMFTKNILTFNPGWDKDAQPVDNYTDIRKLQQQLKSSGVVLQQEADPNTTGPASIMLLDPDGNPILLDQHV